MLSCQRDKFYLPAEVHYLNGAYMSPQMRSVERAGLEAVKRKNLPYHFDVSDFFEPVNRLKALFAQLILTPDSDRVAIIPSVSYGMACVARNVSLVRGATIVTVEDQFPSNVYPWNRLAESNGAGIITVSSPKPGEVSWSEKVMDAIDQRTALVAVPHVHWADGTIFDLEAIRRVAHARGALLVVDGTQSVGALPFDQERIKADALICAGYKWLMGPYSIGLAYFGPAFDHGIALEENWINREGSEDFSRLVDYQHAYRPGAARYSVGEHSNFILVPMMIAALEELLAWEVKSIQKYCRSLLAEIEPSLRELQVAIPDNSSAHLFGLRLAGSFNYDYLKQLLKEEEVYVSFRGNSIRVSTHLYNKKRDLRALSKCIARTFDKSRPKSV
ncbi:MAG: aminotransferase class V-fold PLP-dependent enzyme [Saprospiraceae bacterium]|nr:aminotransferase class V-fold PLP-dependent enzyme [Saprospiraceae bacterium]